MDCKVLELVESSQLYCSLLMGVREREGFNRRSGFCMNGISDCVGTGKAEYDSSSEIITGETLVKRSQEAYLLDRHADLLQQMHYFR